MSSIKCVRCGLVNWSSAEMCQRCGAELVNPSRSAAAPEWKATGYTQADYPPGTSEIERAGPGSVFSIGPFYSIGAVLSPTIEVFTNNLWLITRIILVIFAPYEIVRALSFQDEKANWQTGVGLGLLAIVCNTLATPALIYALVTKLDTGVAPSLTESYRWGIGRLGRIIAATSLAWILEVLGTICFIVPGIILSLAFLVVGPIATLEEHGPVETLKRSYNLTDGYRLRICGASIVLGLLCLLLETPIFLLAFWTGGAVAFWPLNAALNMLTDIINSASIVFSLMVYLSLVRNAPEAEGRTGAIPV